MSLELTFSLVESPLNTSTDVTYSCSLNQQPHVSCIRPECACTYYTGLLSKDVWFWGFGVERGEEDCRSTCFGVVSGWHPTFLVVENIADDEPHNYLFNIYYCGIVLRYKFYFYIVYSERTQWKLLSCSLRQQNLGRSSISLGARWSILLHGMKCLRRWNLIASLQSVSQDCQMERSPLYLSFYVAFSRPEGL